MRTLIFGISLALASFASTAAHARTAVMPSTPPVQPLGVTVTHADGSMSVTCVDWGPSCVPGTIRWEDRDRVFEFGDEVWANIGDTVYVNGFDKNDFVYPYRFDPSGKNTDGVVPAIVIGAVPVVAWDDKLARPYHASAIEFPPRFRETDYVYTVAVQTNSTGISIIFETTRVIPEQAVFLGNY